MVAGACHHSGAHVDAGDGGVGNDCPISEAEPTDGPLEAGPSSLCANPAALANAPWVKTNGPAEGSIFDLTASHDAVLARTWDALNGGRVFLTTDHGATWIQSSAAETDIDILSMVLLDDNSLLAGTWGSSYRFSSGATDWDGVARLGIPAGTAIRSMMTIGSLLYAGTTGNVYRSADSGSTWTTVSPGLPADATVFALAGQGDALFAGTDTSGVFVTKGGAIGWVAANNGLGDMHTSQLVSVGTRLWAVTSGGVFVSDDSGATWAADHSTISGVNRYVVLDAQILAGTDAHGAHFSSDNGVTWNPLGSGLPAGTRVWSLAATSSNLFAGTDSGVWRAECQ